MMTPTCRLLTQHKPPAHFSNTLSTWQCWLLGGYSALFALVLPLICWGAAAEPGHPHRYPHFVFIEPMHMRSFAPVAAPTPMANLHASSAHHGDTKRVGLMKPDLLTCTLQATGSIAGRATPTLMVFSILLLVFLGERVVRRLAGPQVALWRYLHCPESLALPVPLPPPRLPLSAFV